jgi:GT2 family glycosyltransferase
MARALSVRADASAKAFSQGTVPVSVVVPTVGREVPLGRCLTSLAACRPRADEILVVDQSHAPAIARLVGEFSSVGARLVPCTGRGVARGRNVGIDEARHAFVLVTDDDCTVEPNWVETAWRLMTADPAQIVSGRVVPVGDERAVPSTKDDPDRRDYTGEIHNGVLYGNNMVLNREFVVAAGGFDERFGPLEAAEDNDFCYRWLKAGRALRYEPVLVVHHHDWRSPAELEELYFRYARGQGFLYAKHLRRGDLRMLGFMARDAYYVLRAIAAAVVKRRQRWTDPRLGIPRGLPAGLRHGFDVFWLKRPAEGSPVRE